MRNLWIRIGLGAAFVFAAGMFFVTLGRQVKSSVLSTIDQGGRINLPLSIVPFRIDHHRVGHIQQVSVEKGTHGPKRIDMTVRLRHAHEADNYANCLFLLDAPDAEGMVACIPEDGADLAAYRKIGEIRLEPDGLVRPLVVSTRNAEEWFAGADLERVNLSASEQGAIIKVTDADGNKLVDLTANADGAHIRVRDANGKEVVKMNASADGLQLDVKKKQSSSQP
jgi:hypothetical protein